MDNSRLSPSRPPAARRRPGARSFYVLLALAACFAALSSYGQGFRFSTREQAEQAARDRDQQERQAAVDAMLSTPCRERIKNQKIMVLIAEDRDGTLYASQPLYSSHFDAINDRLRALGLRTYTQEEIRRQIAQAIIDANFRNDPEAARTAAKRLAAQYILRGVIASRASQNAVINVNQVTIDMKFTLTAANGNTISRVAATNESFAGRDVPGMAVTLINERADEVVAQLYRDYCSNAGLR